MASSLDPFVVFQTYLGIKMHFKPGGAFDATKYGCRINNVTRDAFHKRKDRFFFEKLARHFKKTETLEEFLICNFVYSGNNIYIRELNDKPAFVLFSRYIALKEGFTKHFEDDIIVLRDQMLQTGLIKTPNDIFSQIEPGTDFPYIINLAMRKQIRLETLLNLDNVFSFLKHINRRMEDSNFLWSDLYQRLVKYQKLMRLRLHNEEVITILKHTFQKELSGNDPHQQHESHI